MTAAGEDPAVYNVNDIRFSIYGEGIHIGRPAIVIELQGCSVGCAFCDCGQMWLKAEKNRAGSFEELHRIPEKWMTLPVDMLGGYALSLLPEALRAQTWQRVIARGVLAVVTGGEPAEQDVKPLARELKRNGFFTLVETSGTADGFVDYLPLEYTPGFPAIVHKTLPRTPFDYVVVSPKIDQPGERELLDAPCSLADEVRMIIRKPSDLPLLSAYLNNHAPKKDAQIFLQPVNRSEHATEICVDAAKRRGWRVSVQLNKYLGIA